MELLEELAVLYAKRSDTQDLVLYIWSYRVVEDRGDRNLRGGTVSLSADNIEPLPKGQSLSPEVNQESSFGIHVKMRCYDPGHLIPLFVFVLCLL